MKRIAVSVTSPIGIISSAIALTTDKSWCIIFLVLSILLIIVGSVFAYYKKPYKQSDSKYELIAFYSFSIVLLTVSISNLYSINRNDNELRLWIAEIENSELKMDLEEESLFKSNNYSEICNQAFKYLYGTDDYIVDIDKAQEYFRYASDNSYAKADIYLGDIYRLGIGHKINPDLAYNLYLKAVKGGYFDGVSYIEELVDEYDHLKTKKEQDLQTYYAYKSDLQKIISEINPQSGNNASQYWLDNVTDSQMKILERFSDEGYVYVNQLLVPLCMMNDAYSDEVKAQKYALRLYEYGFMPDLAYDQLQLIIAMNPSKVSFTNADLYDMSVKYDFYMSLIIPELRPDLNDSFKEYDYCKRQYDRAVGLRKRYPDFNTLNFQALEESVVDQYVNDSKPMLEEAILEIENRIKELYEEENLSI